MEVKIELQQFEGPYELLLDLIKKEELEITEIALAEVTEQYLEYLDQVEQNRAQELSDFLVVASKLLLLKSSELIPDVDKQQEVEEQDLRQQLKIYQKYKKVSKKIEQIWGENYAFVRRTEPEYHNEFIPPDNLTQENLKQKYQKKVDEHEPTEPPIETKVDNTLSLKEKIDHIREHIKQTKNNVQFNQTIEDKNNKSELIVGFLAILELAKQEEVRLKQSSIFGSINIANP